MKQRLAIIVSATALAVALLGSTPAGHAGGPATSSAATEEEFIPGVTDFPTAERFVPGVTDFPRAESPVTTGEPTLTPATPSLAPRASTGGSDWRDVGITSGVGAALAALLVASAFVLTRRARATEADSTAAR